MANQLRRKIFNRYVIAGFVAGLLVGPLITSSLGWQINPSTLVRAVEEAEIALQVKFCLSEAKASGSAGPAMDTEARYDVARKWAKMPWQDAVNETVFSQCYNALG